MPRETSTWSAPSVRHCSSIYGVISPPLHHLDPVRHQPAQAVPEISDQGPHPLDFLSLSKIMPHCIVCHWNKGVKAGKLQAAASSEHGCTALPPRHSRAVIQELLVAFTNHHPSWVNHTCSLQRLPLPSTEPLDMASALLPNRRRLSLRNISLPLHRAFAQNTSSAPQWRPSAALDEWVRRDARPISLRQLTFFGRTLTEERLISSANYVRTELPTRCVISHASRTSRTSRTTHQSNPSLPLQHCPPLKRHANASVHRRLESALVACVRAVLPCL
jgi:hypothetical protein